MPSKIEKIKYTREQDGRVKIMPAQYEEVKEKYNAVKSLRAVAGYYGVDKRTIQFIIYPDRLEKLKEHNRKIKHWSIYYDKDKRRETMRKWRAKKKLTFKNL